MKNTLQRYSLSFLLMLGGIFVPLSGAWASIATPTVLQSSSGPINAPLPALITQSMAVCGSEEVSVGYVLSGSEYKMKCISIADIRSALGISAAPLTCGTGKIAKGISGDGTVLQCRSLEPGCGLTQTMADELNKYSSQSKSIDAWCKTKTLTLSKYNSATYTIIPVTPNTTDGKIHLPNGVRKLNQLTSLTIDNYPVEVIDPWISNLANLEELVIISPGLRSLPSSLGYLSNLKKLVISGGSTKAPITTLPNNLSNLTSLEKLAITQTNITQLPTNFEKLNQLTSLSLQNNNLTSLPEKIGDIPLMGTVNEPQISGFRTGYIYYSYLGDCTNKYCFFGKPGVSGSYTGSLDLSGNQLTHLPVSITKLTNLVGIDLSGNPLTGSGAIPALPMNFGDLVDMREFVLDNTQIPVLPESFSDIANLRQVVITRNPHLKSLPQNFGMLSRLQKLHLQDNGLEELPESFGDLPEFVMNQNDYYYNQQSVYYQKQILNLTSNKLTTLPSSIVKFKNRGALTFLLDGNKISSFPANIGDLDTIDTINLTSNTMTGWVTNLEKTKARTINLSSNQLQTLPDIFSSGSFTHLEKLYINNNSLSSLPSSFGQLSQLKLLELNNNKFTTFPESLTDLTQLQTLSMYGNTMTTLPASIGKMQGLRGLAFSIGYPASANNPFISLPEELGDLVDLTSLSIGGHRLASLPDSFDKLTKLTYLNIFSYDANSLKTLNGLYANTYSTSNKEHNITPTGQGVSIEGGYYRGGAPILIRVGLLACDLLPSEIAELNTLTSSSGSDANWCTGTTSIDLSNKNLSKVPAGLAKLTGLKNIDLSHNQLTTIPLFPAVERLNIAHNNFSSWFGNQQYGGKMLPSTIKFLDISYNNIASLNFDGLTIQEVQANNNGVLTYIPLNIPSLKKVNAANNQISSINLADYYLSPILNLEQLDISNNRVSSFVLTGSQIPKLRYLDLRGNTNIKSLGDLYVSSGVAITQSEGMMTAKDETVTIKSFGDDSPIQITILPDYANDCGITESDLQELKTMPAFYGYHNYSVNKWCSMDKLVLINVGISSLPEWFGKLKNLKELDLGGNDLTVLPASLSGLTKLEGLSIRQNNFTTFPAVITSLTNLRALYIDNMASASENNGWSPRYIDMHGKSSDFARMVSRNQITQIPDSIRNLTNLRKFELKRNAITDLSDGFADLWLTGPLDLSHNQLSSLPDNFGQLTGITSLRLNNNKLIGLSPTFGNLTNLTELFIKGGDNKLLSLPDNFGDLRNLGFQGYPSSQTLDLSEQALSSLPSGFGQFPWLQELSLSNNNLISLPPGFGSGMTRLSYLYLQNTKHDSNGRTIGGITGALPDSFAGMTSIYQMNLSGNDITGLGAFLQSTTWSQGIGLDISDNEITSLPENIGNIRIRNIELHTNKLTTLPDSFYKLRQSVLNLDNNILLTSLPESFSGMTTLTKLDMNNTAITHLPTDFSRLRNLVELNIKDGELTELPSSFGQLAKLEKLDLSGGNKITYLPENFGNLQKLTDLNLHGNNLGEDLNKIPIPDSFANLKITEILLGQNQLRTIPASITAMNKVTKMDLGNNNLESLPEGLGNMTKLSQLNLANSLSSYSPTLSKLPNDFAQLSGKLTELKMSRTNLGSLSSNFSSSTNSSSSQADITNDGSSITIQSAGDNGRISITKN